MKYRQDVNYRISTTLDNTGVAQLQAQLKQLEAQVAAMNKGSQIYDGSQAGKDLKNIQTVSTALSKAYSGKTGLLNLQQFQNELTKQKTSIKEVSDTFGRMGVSGQAAMNQLINQTLSFQQGLRQTSTWADKLSNTFSNTVRWGVVAGAFQEVMSSASKAVSYVKQLDESLTNITMVSGKSRDDMKEFASYANQAAASLSASTTTYTNAVKVFIQEGFNLEESKKQATQAVTLANVSEQDSGTTADQITAYRNAFGLSIEDMSTSLDKIANLANNTASNVGELMTASQRSASTAASVGSSEDTFLAAIATIESVTRDSAENIGNGLKSIYTRFADVSMGKTTDDDVNMNKYANAMKSAGVNILDSNGQYKGFDQVLAELQAQWKTLSDTQKTAVGQTVAGRYQYNRFAALMNNEEYFKKAYNATQGADGAMDRMQEAYNEGINAQLQHIATNFETLLTSIYQSDTVEEAIKAFSKLSDILSDLFDNIDGAIPVLSSLVAIVMKLGGKQLATSVSNAMANKDSRLVEKQNKAIISDIIAEFGGAATTDYQKRTIEIATNANKNKSLLTEEEQLEYQNRMNTAVDAEQKRMAAQKRADDITRTLNYWTGDLGYEMSASNIGEAIKNRFDTEPPSEIKAWRDAAVNSARSQAEGLVGTTKDKDQGIQSFISYLNEHGNGTVGDIRAYFGSKNENDEWIPSENSKFFGFDEKGMSAINNYLDGLGKDSDSAAGSQAKLAEIASQTANAFYEEIDALSLTKKQLESLGDQAGKEAAKATGYGSQVQTNLETAEELSNGSFIQTREKLVQYTDTLGNVGMAATGLSISFSSLKEVYEALGNSTLSAAEKNEVLFSTFVNLSSSAAMLAPMMKQLTELFKAGGGGLGGLAAIGKNIGPLLAVVAGVAALAGAYSFVTDATTKYTQAAEDAQTSLESMESSKTVLSENYDSLKKSLEDLTDSKETIDGMKRGTQEWSDAVAKLNTDVIELTQKYPELMKYVQNTNGVLSLNKTGSEEYLRKINNDAMNASTTSQVLSAVAKSKNNDRNIEEFLNDNMSGSVQQKMMAGAGFGAATGAVIGGGFVGAGVGAVAGGLVGAASALIEHDEMQAKYTSQITELAEQLANPQGVKMGEWNSKVADLAAQMGTTKDSLLNLITGLSENSNALADNTIALQTNEGAVNIDAQQAMDAGAKLNASNWNMVDSSDSYDQQFIRDWAQANFGTDGQQITRVYREDGKVMAEGNGMSEPIQVAQSTDALRDAVNAWTGSSSLTNIIDAAEKSIKEQGDNADVDAIIKEQAAKVGLSESDITSETMDAAKSVLSSRGIDSTWQDYTGYSESIDDITKELGLSSDALSEFEQIVRKNMDATAQNTDATYAALKANLAAAQQAETAANNNITDNQTDIDSLKQQMMANSGYTETGYDNLLTSIQKIQENGGSWDSLSDQETDWVKTAEAAGGYATKLYELINRQKELNSQLDDAKKNTTKAQKSFDDYSDHLEDVSSTALKAKKGLKGLADTMDDYYDILKKKSKGEDVDSAKYAQAISDAKDNLQEALNLDDSAYKEIGGDEFILKNLSTIKKAANGDAEAYKNLQKAALDAMTNSTKFQNAFGDAADEAKTKFQSMASYLQGLDLNIGGSVDMDTSAAQAALGNLTIQTQQEAAQMQAALAAIGFEGQFHWEVGRQKFDSFEEAKEALDALNNSGVKGKKYTLKFKLDKVTKATESNNTFGSSNSSSGSGGGSKSSESKNSKDLDPYQQVNAQLERQQKLLDKLNASYDRLYGPKRIKNLQQQLTAESKYLKLKQKEASIAQKQLQQNLKYKKDPDTGDKTIANWTGKYKGLIASDGSINQSVYEKVANKLFKAKGENTAYENFTKAVENYNSDYNKVQDMLSEIDDAYSQYFETLLKQRDYIDELKDRNDALNESYYSLKNSVYSITDGLASDVDSALDKIKSSENDYQLSRIQFATSKGSYEDILKQEDLLDSTKVKYGKKKYTLRQMMTKYNNATNATTKAKLGRIVENAAKQAGYVYESIDDLESAIADKAQDFADKQQSLVEAYNDKLSSAFDAISTVLDSISDRADKYKDIAADYATINDILTLTEGEDVYGDRIANNRKSLAAYQEQVRLDNLKLSKSQETLANLQSELSNAENDEVKKVIQNKIDELDDDIRSTQSEILSVNKSIADNVKETREFLINDAFNNLISTAFNGSNFNTLSLQWEMNEENAEDFYDKYETTYQKNAIKYQYQQLKNSTSNLNLQNKISKIMKQEMEFLNKQVKLSKTDVEYAQKRYAVLKAQIALQEAQQNKTQLNLQRDSSGNYSYVYTANESEVEEAQNNLAQAQDDAYEVAKNRVISIRESMQDMLEKTNERIIDDVDGSNRNMIISSAKSYYDSLLPEFTEYWNILKRDYGVKSYSDLGYFSDDGILNALTGGRLDIDSLLSDYSEKAESANKDYNDALKNVQSSTDKVSASINDFSDKMFEGSDSFESKVTEDLKTSIDSVNETLEKLPSLISTLNKALAETAAQAKSSKKTEWATQVASATPKTASSIASSINQETAELGYTLSGAKNAKGGTYGVLDAGDIGVLTRSLKAYTGKNLKKTAGTLAANSKVSVNEVNKEDGYVKISSGKLKNAYVSYNTLKKYLAGYDTGGYTGNWSDKGAGLDSKGGKLALLHAKEQVLNKEDTANLLAAVQLVRDMQNEIEAMKTNLGIFSKMSSSENDNAKTIEQRVEITASFPSAKDADDIRQALLSMADTAYQYTN